MKIWHIYIFTFFLSASLAAQTNQKYQLTSVNFEGNEKISSSELKTIILSKESPGWFSQFLSKFSSLGNKAVYFDSLLIPLDIKTLKEFYQSRGYFKAKITSHYTLDSSDESATLTFKINESKPLHFKSFTLKGMQIVAGEYVEQFEEYRKVDTTMVYQNAIVEDKRNFILTFLRDNGYMLAKAGQPTVIVDTIKNFVDVSLGFDAGKRYKIGEIYTKRTGKGIDLVDDDLLKEIVGIKPGTWYSNYEIQRGQVRLFRTNLFTSAAIMSVVSDTVGNVVPLNINADINQMHELSPEIIMNNEDNTFNLGLALNFLKKNFLGDARKFTTIGSVAAQNISEFVKHPTFADSTFYGYADIRMGIEQPFLFGKQITTKFEIYLTSQKRKVDYDSKLYGGKLSLDFDLPQKTYVNSLSGYLNIERSEYDYKVPYLRSTLKRFYLNSGVSERIADSISVLYVSKNFISKSTNALIGVNFGANKTNDAFFPTAGYSLSFLMEDANSIPYLISRIFNTDFVRPLFFKTVITSTFFPQIYSSKTDAFGMKLKLGQIFTYRGEKTEIPLNQRLYSGGSNSVRGWGTRELYTQGDQFNLGANPTQDDLKAFAEGTASGQFFLFEGSIETRNRLFGNFGSALFVDFGNTWNDFKEFRFNELAVAAGFGIRYYSDFFPIRIDIGMKIYDPRDGKTITQKVFWSDTFQFHIGIGEAF